MSTRDEYIAKLKVELDDLNAKLGELETKVHDTKEDVRDRYKAELAKVHRQSKLAVAKLDDLKAAGESSWDGAVAETEKIRDAFVHSFNYFKSQLK
jgi:predicted  nucleic acid-binding Zn-ribbon protein